MLLPVCIREWFPENDLAHFVIDAVAALTLDHFRSIQAAQAA